MKDGFTVTENALKSLDTAFEALQQKDKITVAVEYGKFMAYMDVIDCPGMLLDDWHSYVCHSVCAYLFDE